MWHADCRAGTDKSLPTHPSIKSMQNFDWELATVQWGGGAMLFVRKGRGRVCWAIGWSTAQCWVPCSLYILCFSIQCVDRKRRDLKVTLTGVGMAIGEDVSVATTLLANFSTSGR